MQIFIKKAEVSIKCKYGNIVLAKPEANLVQFKPKRLAIEVLLIED